VKFNVGAGDRVFRISLGLMMLASVFVLGERYWWLGLIGLVPLATGIAGYCPAYSLFGMNTNGRKKLRI
jgi:hypothetical protein